MSTATNWTRVIDEFRMQESISEDALKAFNLKDERSFLSREEEQSTFAHIVVWGDAESRNESGEEDFR